MSVTPTACRLAVLCLGSALAAQGPTNPSILAPLPESAAQLERRVDGAAGTLDGTGKARAAVVHLYLWVAQANPAFKLERPSSAVVIDAGGLALCNLDQVHELQAEPKKYQLKAQLQDGSVHTAKVLQRSEDLQLALVQIQLPEGRRIPSVEIAMADDLPPGSGLRVLGFPDGEHLRSYGGVAVPTQGAVRIKTGAGAKTLPATRICLSDAPLPENAHGAALLNARGRLVALANTSMVGAEIRGEPTYEDLARPSYGVGISIAGLTRHFRGLPAMRAHARPIPDGLAKAVAKAAAAVVSVYTGSGKFPEPAVDDPYAERRVSGLGSGVIIDSSGLLLTNDHLIVEGARIRVRLHDGAVREAKLVARHRMSNVACLKLSGKGGLPALPLADPASLASGTRILCLGRPYRQLTVTAGILSASRSRRGANLGEQRETGAWLQVDAKVGNHNGGGALINDAGQLVGIPDGGRVDPLRVAVARSAAEKKAAKLDTGMYFVPGIARVLRRMQTKIDAEAPANPDLGALAKAAPARGIAAEVVERCAQSSVNIYVSWSSKAADEEENPFVPSKPTIRTLGLGSGVIITADGLCLTNWHVVDAATEPTGAARKDHAVHAGLKTGERYPCEVISISREDDLALIKLQLPAGTTLTPAELGDSKRLQVGETVVALGNPHGAQNTATAGVLVAKGQSTRVRGRWAKLEPLLETDAAINGGNSGGGLFDACGRLIGINSAGGGGRAVTSWSIPINHARLRINELLLGAKKMRRVYTGMRLADEDGKVRIQGLNPQGPAARAGFRAGDQLLSLDGTAISWSPGLKLLLRKKRADTPLDFSLQRDGKQLQLSLTPLSAAAWAIFKQTGLECMTHDMREDTAQLQAANLAVHRAFTGNPAATPRQLRASCVKVTRIIPGAHEDHPLQLQVGDLIFGLELSQRTSGGNRTRMLHKFESLQDMADFFNHRAYGVYEGALYKAWIYRGDKALSVQMFARRLLY